MCPKFFGYSFLIIVLHTVAQLYQNLLAMVAEKSLRQNQSDCSLPSPGQASAGLRPSTANPREKCKSFGSFTKPL